MEHLMKKYILLLMTSGLFFLNCGKCDNEPPSVTLVNNGTAKADIQIKTSEGNTENVNNVMPGTTAPKRTFIAGKIEFTIGFQGDTSSIKYDLETQNCNDYTVIIKSDNTVTSAGRVREK
jgi:hypothetical protein